MTAGGAVALITIQDIHILIANNLIGERGKGRSRGGARNTLGLSYAHI